MCVLSSEGSLLESPDIPVAPSVPLRDWAQYYKWRGFEYGSPIAALLQFPLTVYYIVSSLLPKQCKRTRTTHVYLTCQSLPWPSSPPFYCSLHRHHIIHNHHSYIRTRIANMLIIVTGDVTLNTVPICYLTSR